MALTSPGDSVHRIRYVAIGDSFTEGVGDELPDGTPRGWADLAAQAWANALGRPIEYANLAIRGRLVQPILETQLEPALALRPSHLSFNGGGNDMLRPRTDIELITDAFAHVLRRCDEEGVQLIVLAGANPSGRLPLGGLVQRRGDALSRSVTRRLEGRPDVLVSDNWDDDELRRPEFWAEDRLHLGTRGHHRVAARLVATLGFEPPADWWDLGTAPAAASLRSGEYYRRYVAPWVRRRLAGTSSGDARRPKYPDWIPIAPTVV